MRRLAGGESGHWCPLPNDPKWFGGDAKGCDRCSPERAAFSRWAAGRRRAREARESIDKLRT